MKVGVPTEVFAGERRVAATPKTVARLKKLGFEVLLQAGAGAGAEFPDSAYADAGAEIVPDAAALWSAAEVVLKVRPPEPDEVALTREGQVLACFLWPAAHPELVESLAARGVTALAMDCVPRISRAQKMDALSSMANISGYRAVIEAASRFGSFFTGQITAAGKIAPATVLVIGVGVAGLAAIAAAKGLGARVRAFDTRLATKEQVQSLGAEFLELEFEEDGEGGGGYAKVMSEAFIAAEMALFNAQAPEVDIVITTALIPGKPAPVLWTEEAVQRMKPGSVVVDLAAEQGGNCPLTVPGEAVVRHGVHLIGYTDLSSRLANTASQLYGTNLCHLLSDMGGAAEFRVDLEDEVVRGALVTHQGETTWPPPKPKPASAKPPPAKPEPAPAAVVERPPPEPPAAPVGKRRKPIGAFLGLAGLGLWLALRFGVSAEIDPAVAALFQHLTVFVLACFVGWQVIWSVTPALHTPLMSVTNAISGIIVVGGMMQARGDITSPAAFLGIAAVLLATINIVGGFLVTQRMLRMFHR